MTPDTILLTTPSCPRLWVLRTLLCRNGIGHAEQDLTGYAIMGCAKRRFGFRVQPIAEPRDWFAELKPQVEAQLRVRTA